MLADEFPLMDVFLTILVFFDLLVIAGFMAWCLFDNFRRRDLGGWAKAGWMFVILILPLVGGLIYVVARPSDDIGGPFVGGSFALA